MGLIISLVAGFFIWSGFAPLEFPLGPYIGLALLYRNLLDRGFRVRLLRTTLTGLAFFLPLLQWSGSYVGWVPWLSLALLQTSLFALLSMAPVKANLQSALFFAASFNLIELLRMKWPFGGFGWGRIGHTQVELIPGLYSIVGVAGISFSVALIAALFSIIKWKYSVLLPFPILVSLLAPYSNATGFIQISAVQGGVDQLGLDYNERALSVLNRHATTTELISNKPELVIWPENASDIDPLQDSRARAIINETIEKLGTQLLVGAVLRDDLGPKNVSILYNRESELESLYIKQDLAPFGEYMPIRDIAEFISPQAARVRDFQAGKKWVSHEVSGKVFQSVICFEVLDDDFLREGLQKSEFVVAQTNNATFGTTPQAQQQLQIIRARAAEFQRDFAVVSTTGFTAHVNSQGEIVSTLEQFKPGVLDMRLESRAEASMASRLRSWLWVGVFLLALAFYRRSVFSR